MACFSVTPAFAQSTDCTLNGVSPVSCVLNGSVAVTSGYTGPSGSTSVITSTINNNSNIQFNAVGSNTVLGLGGNATLQGTGGTLTLRSVGGNQVTVQENTGPFTLTNSTKGDGMIGSNGLALVNSGSGTVNANVSGGTLTLNGGGAVTNTGLMRPRAAGICRSPISSIIRLAI